MHCYLYHISLPFSWINYPGWGLDLLINWIIQYPGTSIYIQVEKWFNYLTHAKNEVKTVFNKYKTDKFYSMPAELKTGIIDKVLEVY